MSHRRQGAAVLLALGAAWVGPATDAEAGAFGLRTQSTVALGQSFAGAAAGGGGLSSIFWNPATITMSPGYASEYNFSYVGPNVRVRPEAPTPTLPLGPSGEIGQDALVPASATAYQFSEDVWLGLSTGAPFGSITKPRDVWAGQTYSRSSRVFSLNVAPVVGIRLNEWVSVGFGPAFQYFKVRLHNAAAPAPTAPNVILEGNDYGVGFLGGVTLTPAAGTVIGVGYRSTIRHELDGTLRVPGTVFPVRVDVNLPDTVTVGITQAITPEFRLSAGFEWMNWSRLGTKAVNWISTGTPLAAFPLNYKDGFIYSVGGEYMVDPALTLRAGVAFEQSPIDVSNRSTRLPDVDRIYASLGASYAWSEKLTLNASYSHVFKAGGGRIAIAPGSPLYNGLPFFADSDADVNVVSVSLRYRWDDVAVAQPAPLIRKN